MKKKFNSIVTCLAFLFLFFIYNSFGQTAEINGKAWLRQNGNNSIIAVHLDINKGAYLYHTDLGDPNALGTPLKISLSPSSYEIQKFFTSPPESKSMDSFSNPGNSYNVNIHKNFINIFLIIKKNINLEAVNNSLDTQKLTVHINGQACNKQRCLQVSLAIPVTTNATSAEAEKVFSLIPDLEQFKKPLNDWASSSNDLIDNNSGSLPFLISHNANTKLTNTENPSASDSILDLIDQDVSTTDSIPVLPDFNIHKETHEYSLLVWLLLALLAGILLNFMPCVLPVISFKIFGFINQAHENRRKLILLSLCFSGGILTVFIILAFAAAGLGMQWGEQFQSETFNIILACLVFAFALSFLGVFEFSAPVFAGKLQNDKAIPQEGYLGTYITGIVATLMATPCSGPFLGATISWALTQSAITVMAVFICIGIGMALPYFLLSLSSRLRSFLPKPGDWMLTFRTIMGFILLLTVIYLMIFIRSDNLLATCALMVFIAFACWIYGKYATVINAKPTRYIAKISSITIIAIGIYVIFYILNPAIFRQNITSASTRTIAVNQGESTIIPFDFKAFKNDLDSGKNILVDFTADWCPNCQYNTHYVFTDKSIQEKLKTKGVIFYEADITEDTPKTKEIRNFLNSIGGSAIPYVGLFPANNPTEPYVLPDILSVSKVNRYLNKLPDIKDYKD